MRASGNRLVDLNDKGFFEETQNPLKSWTRCTQLTGTEPEEITARVLTMTKTQGRHDFVRN